MRDELDLPTLEALRKHWARFPPVGVMLAAKWGFSKPQVSLEEQDAVPVQAMPSEEFDAMLQQIGIRP